MYKGRDSYAIYAEVHSTAELLAYLQQVNVPPLKSLPQHLQPHQLWVLRLWAWETKLAQVRAGSEVVRMASCLCQLVMGWNQPGSCATAALDTVVSPRRCCLQRAEQEARQPHRSIHSATGAAMQPQRACSPATSPWWRV